MSMYLRHKGYAVSREGAMWRVEIWQESEGLFETVGQLAFDADSPIVITWDERGKDAVLCGSSAVLRIISPGDRTYEDMYTIKPGEIRVDIYRDDSIYWSGTLDPEFYEEPYERYSDYVVSLTFTDFGVFDRLGYGLSGMRTLREIVDYCIGKASIVTTVDDSLISTGLTADGGGMSLSDLEVRSDNFYDEDGEALKLKDVLEGILQPLALRMVQRDGRVYIYDLDALYRAGSRRVEWSGDRQTLGADVVYNNAKITWSTYAQSGIINKADCWTVKTDPNITAINMINGLGVLEDGSTDGGLGLYDTTKVFSYRYGSNPNDPDMRLDATAVGFSLWVSRLGEHVEILDDRARFFKVVQQNEGADCEGVAISWPSVYVTPSAPSYEFRYQFNGMHDSLAGSFASPGSAIFKTGPVWLPPVTQSLELHVVLEALVDPRVNFYNEAVDFAVNKATTFTAKKLWDRWKKTGNFVFVPVRVVFEADNGARYCWDNRAVVGYTGAYPVNTIASTKGEWKPYTGSEWGYLAYYSADDRMEDTGMLDWSKNRPAINPHSDPLTLSLRLAEGQYIPYPATGGRGGKVYVEVCAGWVATNHKGEDKTSSLLASTNYFWALCKVPTIEIVDYAPHKKEIPGDDVEYSAVINADAREPLELETICGSSAEGIPTARGAYFRASDGRQITELTRAGRTSQIEDLLIGTLFSQFGARRTKLSGEMRILSGTLAPYTEQCQADKKFIVVADTQDLVSDVSDAVITELRPDEYERRDD